MSSTRAEHLRAHASRLLACAGRFRHGGHYASAEDLTTQAAHYVDEAARLEAPDQSLLGAHFALGRIDQDARIYKPGGETSN